MIQNYKLSREKTALLVVDVQERLFREVERPCEVLPVMQTVIKGFQVMRLPIVITEQYPQGLGPTVTGIKNCLEGDYSLFTKTTFSCLGDKQIKDYILNLSVTQWVLIGIEAHVCILQTAKDLLAEGRQVVILNDAITSRSIFDFSTAISELRDCGARISSAETVLFELLGDSKAAEFKEISQLVK